MSLSNYNKIETNNAKTFGNRDLKNQNDIFKYNAWDNVDLPIEEEIKAKSIIKQQKLTSVLNQEELENLACQKWNDFYKKHSNRFFMDRNWITREFPEIVTSCSKVYLESKIIFKLLNLEKNYSNS